MKFILSIVVLCTFAHSQNSAVTVGADVLLTSEYSRIQGKRIAIVTNHSAVLANGKHLVDALYERNDVTVKVLFGPEHGVRGDAPDGRTVTDTIDDKTRIPVISLYGKINKPTPAMLKDVDIVLFDIQDVGARFYTFISTMFLCMEAAAENNIPFVVLDRPNPITGLHVEGPLRLDSLKSFVGWVPMPIVHGMTVGELATMANNEGWLHAGVKANLHVVKMKQWNRSMWFDETGLRWIKPSPNMSSLNTSIVYPGMCLIEGINVSEGRGTERPFEYIGAPWINGKALAKLLNDEKLPGVIFEPIVFTPKEIPSVASHPKYENQLCSGIFVRLTDRNVFQSVTTGLAVVWGINKLHRQELKFRDRGFDRLMGTPVPRMDILNGRKYDVIEADWMEGIKLFHDKRQKALLY